MREDNRTTNLGQSYWRIGAVSYLNAKPLVYGLDHHPDVRLNFDVPAHLADDLATDAYDAALIPVIDLIRRDCDLTIISDACIASDGETLTVRVFSQIPPADIRQIQLDPESHTSVVLMKLLWPALFGHEVMYGRFDPEQDISENEAILLIGDKVVGVDADVFRYQIDLGGAWKTWTGLPFVFAVWAARADQDHRALGKTLSMARDHGVDKAEQLAVEYGPSHGWSPALAQEYLKRYLKFELTEQRVQGLLRFLDLARSRNLSPHTETLQLS